MVTRDTFTREDDVLVIVAPDVDVDVFRATMTVALMVLAFAGLALVLAADAPALSVDLVAAGLIGAVVGWGVGAFVFRRLHPGAHRRAVTGLLVATAVTSLVAGLLT